jgi:hypothetical protein
VAGGEGRLGGDVGQVRGQAVSELRCRGGEPQDVMRGVAVAGGKVCPGVRLDAGQDRQVVRARGQADRDALGAAGGVAALALDDAVHSQLRHPTPGGELAAGDRDEAGARLVDLRPA